MKNIILILIIWNIIVFLMYGIDKWKSINNKWRIKESTLIISAALMGSLGAILGMLTYRHKVSKTGFKVCIGGAVIVNILILCIYFYYIT